MAAYVKYCLLLFVYFSAFHRGHASVIDSLSTNEDVQKFLVANLGKKGIIFQKEWSYISRSEEERYYFFKKFPQHFSVPDTLLIDDPVSHTKIVKVAFRDSLSRAEDSISHHTIFESVPSDNYYPVDSVTKLMERTSWQFFKGDIDCNGKTDLVIDAGIVVIIMDIDGSFEGHMFSTSTGWTSYGFRSFISLPDGTCALLLRHDVNSCKSVEHSCLFGTVTYITDTTYSSTTSSIKIDTLYKITTGTRTNQLRVDGPPSLDAVKIPYADTVDMKLYNKLDTIVYKSIGFIPYNHGIQQSRISKIDYYYGRSYGMSRDYNACLEIDSNGTCHLKYSKYDTISSGFLGNKRTQELWNFISCINFNSYDEINRIETSSGIDGTFAVHFDDGTVRKINFWALGPPMELGYLSNALSNISKTLNWQFSEMRSDFECPCTLPALEHYDERKSFDNMCSCEYQ